METNKRKKDKDQKDTDKKVYVDRQALELSKKKKIRQLKTNEIVRK